MHRHVGDERAGGDIASATAAEQRRPQPRGGELDDVEAAAGERDADHLDRARVLAADREAPGRRVGAEQRRRPRRLDRARLVRTRDRLLVLRPLLGLVEGAQPLRDARVGGDDDIPPPERTHVAPAEVRLDRAHRHRQHTAFRRLDDAEAGGELDQGRRVVGGDVERKACGIRQRPAAVVGQLGGQLDAEVRALGERSLEGDGVDILDVRLDRLGRQRLAARVDQPNPRGEHRRDLPGEAHRQRFDRRARRGRVGAAALEARDERRADEEVETARAQRRKPVGSRDAAPPDDRDAPAGGQRTTATRGDHDARRGGSLGQRCTADRRRQQPADAVVLLRLHHDRRTSRIGQEVERHRLPDPIDRAARIRGDRCRRRRGIERDKENLVLGNAVVAIIGHRCADVRAAGIEGEAALPADPRARRVLQPGDEGVGAPPPAGERRGQVDRIILRVDPATGRARAARPGDGCGSARVAERDHRRREAHLDLLDPLDRTGRREGGDRGRRTTAGACRGERHDPDDDPCPPPSRHGGRMAELGVRDKGTTKMFRDRAPCYAYPPRCAAAKG